MTDAAAAPDRSAAAGGSSPLARLRALGSGITAVGVKELRGRMRGRRAFVILTFYLLFLAGFAWAWELIAERAYGSSARSRVAPRRSRRRSIGQEVFGALVIVETLLVVFLAPAFTSGAISLEREKQTLDMLAATPISSLAIVVGKLLSALAYVFLLIVASIPLTAIVFVFGGVGPDDVLRGYVVLFVSAIGLGSLGLFISAADAADPGGDRRHVLRRPVPDARDDLRRPVLDHDGRPRAEPAGVGTRASGRSRAGRRRRCSGSTRSPPSTT